MTKKSNVEYNDPNLSCGGEGTCSHCGATVFHIMRYCYHCGSKLNWKSIKKGGTKMENEKKNLYNKFSILMVSLSIISVVVGFVLFYLENYRDAFYFVLLAYYFILGIKFLRGGSSIYRKGKIVKLVAIIVAVCIVIGLLFGYIFHIEIVAGIMIALASSIMLGEPTARTE